MRFKKLKAFLSAMVVGAVSLAGTAINASADYYPAALYYTDLAKLQTVSSVEDVALLPQLEADLNAMAINADYNIDYVNMDIVPLTDTTFTMYAGNIGVNFGYDVFYDHDNKTIIIEDIYGVITHITESAVESGDETLLLIPDAIDFASSDAASGTIQSLNRLNFADFGGNTSDYAIAYSDKAKSKLENTSLTIEKINWNNNVINGINDNSYDYILFNKSLDKFVPAISGRGNFLALTGGFVVDEENETLDVINNDIIVNETTGETIYCVPHTIDNDFVKNDYVEGDILNIIRDPAYVVSGVKNIGPMTFTNQFWLSLMPTLIFDKTVDYIDYNAMYDLDDSMNNLQYLMFENPDCDIQLGTISTNKDINIIGYDESTAQAYAEKQGYNFINLDDVTIYDEEVLPEATMYGDVNLDGTIGISDTAALAKYNANSDLSPITAQGKANGDVARDGIIDAFDVNKLIEYNLNNIELEKLGEA